MIDVILKEALHAARLLLILLISGGFLGLGMLKLVSHPGMVGAFQSWNFPDYSIYIIGTLEMALSILIFYSPTRIKALILAIFFMIAAFNVHLIFSQFDQLYGPMTMLVMLVSLLIIEKKLKKN